jgi:hypothetical protein
MPRYVVERVFDQRLEKLSPRTSQKAMRLMAEQFTSLVWEHSHVVASTDEGIVRTFCIYQAPDPETVRAHAESVGGHVVVNVYELAGDVTPADIPPEGQDAAEEFFDVSTGDYPRT